MAALAAKNTHVPYRNSKLTQLLQDSLQGNAKVMMFMHISPEANMFSESVSTLKFATRVSQITLGQVCTRHLAATGAAESICKCSPAQPCGMHAACFIFWPSFCSLYNVHT